MTSDNNDEVSGWGLLAILVAYTLTLIAKALWFGLAVFLLLYLTTPAVPVLADAPAIALLKISLILSGIFFIYRLFYRQSS